MSYYPAYWIEAAKRAYAEGDDRAMGWIDHFLNQPQDRLIDYLNLPPGMFDTWNGRSSRDIPKDLR